MFPPLAIPFRKYITYYPCYHGEMAFARDRRTSFPSKITDITNWSFSFVIPNGVVLEPWCDCNSLALAMIIDSMIIDSMTWVHVISVYNISVAISNVSTTIATSYDRSHKILPCAWTSAGGGTKSSTSRVVPALESFKVYWVAWITPPSICTRLQHEYTTSTCNWFELRRLVVWH